ncbi:putative major facilitator superfamily transporter [Paecilomyces variotii No. 5]|uniref:Putative major facilitator superfamily transporter n=1 Tax=Byssochlamys spectabilis (strain No. 5 / NBRC 109023) TaxID=1356009 RepID=V5HWL1_BYSSN|nr:putative major facilitator superfamily transporter [Paecilomyces variotii No. 5]
MGAAIVIALLRGPWETGWIGWRGGCRVREQKAPPEQSGQQQQQQPPVDEEAVGVDTEPKQEHERDISVPENEKSDQQIDYTRFERTVPLSRAASIFSFGITPRNGSPAPQHAIPIVPKGVIDDGSEEIKQPESSTAMEEFEVIFTRHCTQVNVGREGHHYLDPLPGMLPVLDHFCRDIAKDEQTVYDDITYMRTAAISNFSQQR